MFISFTITQKYETKGCSYYRDFQENSRFVKHVKEKLIKANKGLYVLRTLRKVGYRQREIDHLFKTLVLPKLVYGLSVYGASEAELTIVQGFLDHCFKRNYISHYVDIREQGV